MDILVYRLLLTHDAASSAAVYGGHFWEEGMLCLISSWISRTISQRSIAHTGTYQMEKPARDLKSSLLCSLNNSLHRKRIGNPHLNETDEQNHAPLHVTVSTYILEISFQSPCLSVQCTSFADAPA